MKKRVHVVPWFKGKWRVVTAPSLLFLFWSAVWKVYYWLYKKRYEWKEE